MKNYKFIRNSKNIIGISFCIGFSLTGLYLKDRFQKLNILMLNTNKNFIYSWGSGISGQLGVGEEKNSQPIPREIKESNITNAGAVIAAFDVSCTITKTGDLYVWGKTKDGALGLFPGGTVNINTPQLFVHSDDIDSKPIEVDFSKEHGALVTLNGSLYTWGVDNHSKLGHTEDSKPQISQKQRRIPKNSYEMIKFAKVNLQSNIISAKCGYNHTVCLTKDGQVYTWGFGKDGALGHGDYSSSSLPKKIEFFEKNNIRITKIECGDYFTIALSENGKIYTWGHNNYGQLGLGRISQQLKINSPTEVRLNDKIIKGIYAGEDHCACITDDGEGYIWGYGIDGRLGNKNKMNINSPVKILIEEEKIKKISCGGHHTAILTESGDLYMCGNGRDGELGRGDVLESHSVNRDEPLLVSHFKHNKLKVIDVACGSSHTLALVQQENFKL